MTFHVAQKPFYTYTRQPVAVAHSTEGQVKRWRACTSIEQFIRPQLTNYSVSRSLTVTRFTWCWNTSPFKMVRFESDTHEQRRREWISLETRAINRPLFTVTYKNSKVIGKHCLSCDNWFKCFKSTRRRRWRDTKTCVYKNMLHAFIVTLLSLYSNLFVKSKQVTSKCV